MRALLGLAFVFGLAACDRGPTAPDQFLIKVDSISAPARATTAPFEVTFHGTIGGSTCSSLRRIEKDYGDDAIDFTFIGERCADGNGRAMMMELHETETVRFRLYLPMTIRVHQPDGTTITRTVVPE